MGPPVHRRRLSEAASAAGPRARLTAHAPQRRTPSLPPSPLAFALREDGCLRTCWPCYFRHEGRTLFRFALVAGARGRPEACSGSLSDLARPGPGSSAWPGSAAADVRVAQETLNRVYDRGRRWRRERCEQIERRAEQVLAEVPSFVWDGESVPVPGRGHRRQLLRPPGPRRGRPHPGTWSGSPTPPASPVSSSPPAARSGSTPQRPANGPPAAASRSATSSATGSCTAPASSPSSAARSRSRRQGRHPPAPPGSPRGRRHSAAALLMPGHLMRHHYEECNGDFEEMCRRFGSSGAAGGAEAAQEVGRRAWTLLQARRQLRALCRGRGMSGLQNPAPEQLRGPGILTLHRRGIDLQSHALHLAGHRMSSETGPELLKPTARVSRRVCDFTS